MSLSTRPRPKCNETKRKKKYEHWNFWPRIEKKWCLVMCDVVEAFVPNKAHWLGWLQGKVKSPSSSTSGGDSPVESIPPSPITHGTIGTGNETHLVPQHISQDKPQRPFSLKVMLPLPCRLAFVQFFFFFFILSIYTLFVIDSQAFSLLLFVKSRIWKPRCMKFYLFSISFCQFLTIGDGFSMCVYLLYKGDSNQFLSP